MTTVVPVPEWLALWRERNGVSVSDEAATAPTATQAVRTAPTPRVDSQGFIEPGEWPEDDHTRREAVLDTDQNPPRVVRWVGWRSCMKCRRGFFSKDVQRVRLCAGCKAYPG